MSWFFQLSKYGGSAWEWDELREQFYYHYYDRESPDFNFRNDDIIRHLHVTFMNFYSQY